MLEFALIAQLAGPRCGGLFGIKPDDQFVIFTGCTVPDSSNPYGTRLRVDPLTPGGIKASPAGPSPLPTVTTY